MIDWLKAHSSAVLIVTLYIASAAVSSMPPPKDNASPWYAWFYKFANALLANVSAIRGKAQYDDAKQLPPLVGDIHDATLHQQAAAPKQ